MDVAVCAAVLASAAVCAVAAVSFFRLWIDARQGAWLRERAGRLCDMAEGAGVSLLSSGVRRIGTVEELLLAEYARFEAIVVVDGREDPRLLEELVSSYSLFRTDYRPGTELPVFGVRGLYRSQCRCFRRLVVLDRARTLPSDDWNAAAGVASFDWLLPLAGDVVLRPRGLCRLMAEVNRTPPGKLRAVVSTVGASALLISWSEVAAAGGFPPHPLRHLHRDGLRRIGEPVTEPEPRTGRRGWLPALGTVLLLAALSLPAGAAAPYLFLVSVLTVGAAVWGAAPLVAPEASPWTARQAALDWLLRKFTVKNFTIP